MVRTGTNSEDRQGLRNVCLPLLRGWSPKTITLLSEGLTRITKSTRCTNFSNLFLEWNSACFRQFLCPSSGVFHCTHSNRCMSYRFADSLRTGSRWNCSYILILLASCQQNCMTYTIAVCIMKNSWWWTEELSETYRVLFQNKFEKLVHLVGCWTCSCWTLTASSNYTSNNPPRMQNQRLLVQF